MNESYLRNEDRFFINDRESDPIFDVRFAGISYPNPQYIKRRAQPMELYVFAYVIRGCGMLTGIGEAAELREGDLYVINTQYPQVCTSDREDPFELIWINASGTLLDHLAGVYIGSRPFVIRHNSHVAYERLTAAQELLRDSSMNRETAMDRVALILHELLILLRRADAPPSAEYAGLAAAVRGYIDRNLHRNFSLGEITAKYFVSKNHVIRTFHEAFDITPKQYQLKRRVEMAEVLMENTGMTLEEIAAQLGFSSLQHFSTAYKKQRGFPPKKYKMRGDS